MAVQICGLMVLKIYGVFLSRALVGLWGHQLNTNNNGPGLLFAITCENIRFSSLFAAGDVSRGGTSAIQLHKFHTDDVPIGEERGETDVFAGYYLRLYLANCFQSRSVAIDGREGHD